MGVYYVIFLAYTHFNILGARLLESGLYRCNWPTSKVIPIRMAIIKKQTKQKQKTASVDEKVVKKSGSL